MATNGKIMVINRTFGDGENIKELIEFMDAPEVCTATPADWVESAGASHLDAVFIGADLTEGEVRKVVCGVADVDPNIPIVMLHENEGTA